MAMPSEFVKKFLAKASISMPEFRGITADKAKGTWIPTIHKHYGVVVKQKVSHSEMVIEGKKEAELKAEFYGIHNYRNSVERIFRDELRWEAPYEKSVTRKGKTNKRERGKIMSKPILLGYADEGAWDELIEKLLQDMSRFLRATNEKNYEQPVDSIEKPEVGVCPQENDYEEAARQIGRVGEIIPISDIEDQIEKNMKKRGISLQPGWRRS